MRTVPVEIELIAGDASPRQYYRVTPSNGSATLTIGGGERQTRPASRWYRQLGE